MKSAPRQTLRRGRAHIGRWAAVAVLATGVGFLLLGGVAGSDSSITVTQGDFTLTCPAGTVAENATLACTLTNTAAEAKPWPVVAILHLSTDDDRALVRGTSIDVTLGAPSPEAAIDGGVTWIGDTLVGYSRFDWSGNAGADPTKTTTTVAAPGNTRSVNIVAEHDSLDEDSEKFYVALGPDGSKGVGILYNNKTSVTVTDDDSPSTDKSLSSLKLSAGRSHTLSPTQATQSRTVAYEVTEATLTAVAAHGEATMAMGASFGGRSLDLDGQGGTSIEVISDQESAAVPLAVGTTTVTLTVTAEDGTTTGTHAVSIVRSALGEGVDTVAVSVPSFTLTCPAEVAKATDAQCTLRASGSAGWPVVAVVHSSADGASRALVAEDPILPDTDPGYSKDVSLGNQQPARTGFNYGYGELLSGGSLTLYRTYGYEKFDWSGTASAGATRTVTIHLHDNDRSISRAEVFYVALAPSGYTGLSKLVDNKVPILIRPMTNDSDPVFAADSVSLRVAEGVAAGAAVGAAVTAVDGDEGAELTYRLGGADAAGFAIDSVTGQISVWKALDFETPNDADGDGVHELSVSVSDGLDSEAQPDMSADDSIAVFVEVTDVDDAPVLTSSGCDLVIAEDVYRDGNIYYGGDICTVEAFDAEAVPLTWSLSGADAAGFTLIATTTPQPAVQEQSRMLFFKSRGDGGFEAPDDADGDNVHEVTVTASDGNQSASVGLSVSLVTVEELITQITTLYCHPAQRYDAANSRWTLAEPQEDADGWWPVVAGLVAGRCSVDPEDARTAWSLSGADAAMFHMSAEGVLSFAAAPDFEAPADSDGDNVYEVTVTAAGVHTVSVNITVAVTDTAEPVVIIIEAPPPNPDAPSGAAVSGNELTLTFDWNLAAVDDATADALRYAFFVQGAFHLGTPVTQSPNHLTVDGATVTLTLGTPIAPGDVVVVNYNARAGNGFHRADGTPITDFTAGLVTTPRN